MERSLKDGDYKLRDGKAWFSVGKFSVRIAAFDGGVVCSVYPLGHEMDTALAHCAALDEQVEMQQLRD